MTAMSTIFVHQWDYTTCDDPEGDVSDPDNICGHGHLITEIYV